MELTGIQKWHELDGDNTLALDWDLNEKSLVWEIGGFEGRWAQQILDKFHCHITIFEPQHWAVEKLHKRFDWKKVRVESYGLFSPDMGRGYEWESFSLGSYETDGTSIYSDKYPIKALKFRDYTKELDSFYGNVNLMLMNIEGMEFNLLPHMAESLYITRFDTFWVQFHPGLVQDGEEKAKRIFEDIGATHELLWNCYPTAVAWKRK